MLARAGEIAAADIRGHEDRNRLLRTLGNDRAQSPTVPAAPLTLAAGDVFLLCTDGFWEYVTEADLEIALAKLETDDPADWLRLLTERLLERAPADHDNYTAMAVFVAAAYSG